MENPCSLENTSTTEVPKRFDDWPKVDCEECERWWTNQCDGASKGSSKPCNVFLATRRTSLPLDVARLSQAVRGLKREVLTFELILLLWMVLNVLRMCGVIK